MKNRTEETERRIKAKYLRLKELDSQLYRRCVELGEMVTIDGGSLSIAARVEEGAVSLALDALKIGGVQ